MVDLPISSLAFIFNIMLYIEINSVCKNWNNYYDEVLTSIPMIFKKWDKLESNSVFPERIIESVEVKNV